MAVVVIVAISTQATKGNAVDKTLISRKPGSRQCFCCGDTAARELVEAFQVGIDGRTNPTGYTRELWVCLECLTGKRKSNPRFGLSR